MCHIIDLTKISDNMTIDGYADLYMQLIRDVINEPISSELNSMLELAERIYTKLDGYANNNKTISRGRARELPNKSNFIV